MPPAATTPGRAERDLVEGDHRGLHAGAAHLVDGGRGHLFAEARGEARLAGGGLALACGQDAAHHAFLDGGRGECRVANRRGEGGPAKDGGRGFGEGALEAPDGRSCGACNEDFVHDAVLLPPVPRSVITE